MYKPSGTHIILLFAGIFLLAGCVTPQLKVDPINPTDNPAELMEKLGKDLSAAKQKRVHLLSPSWYALAQSSYDKAQAGIGKGALLSKVLEYLATGQAQLQQAQNYADKSRKVLADVIESRDAALAARADQFKQEFARLETGFLKLTRAVENADEGTIQKKKKSVNDGYRELELRVIKETVLGELSRMVAKAKKDKLDRAAPKSFALAQSKLANAEAVITQDRYAENKIAEAVENAWFYAKRMQEIAKTSLQYKEIETPEDIVLKVEQYFTETISRLKAPDSRHLSFDGQQKVIADAIASLERNQASAYSMAEAQKLENKKLRQRIADLEGRSYQERADRERLAAEKQFNELYNQVQDYFSSEEADVYKKGSNLVIRLKAIRFPVGQAVIMPDNYVLLSTVLKAVNTFDAPDVVVEGHTDSTGAAIKNKELSQQRAEAVKRYLVFNGRMASEKVTAIGYGASQPLASNQTAHGRAINRRIDVIIKPIQQ